MIKQRLLPHTVTDFRKRFGLLHDAVVHEVKLDLFSKTKTQNMKIVLGVKDNLYPKYEDNQWINVIFDIENVSRVTLRKEGSYYFDIIFTLLIDFVESEIFLDFTADKTQITKPNDISEAFNQTNAAFAVIGEKCFWYTAPYKER